MSHPGPNPRATTADAPSDELVLAAIERAARHRARDTPAVPVWAIFEHLAVPQRSAAARRVRERLEALRADGQLERSRRHGVVTWALSGTGLRHLRLARRAGGVPALPQSPQHLAWQVAHTAGAQEIERFRASLRERLDEAALLLDAREPPHSDVWLELAEELQRACRRVASASHCLNEWAEPDDERADVDELLDPGDVELDPTQRARRRARRAGRRNIRLWNDASGL
ncbi:MAG TPA: hypothetical protein VK778_16730 [Solirubrobacteraceae bacterium]|jgi:hypothetical protein|nr:hypothetical protein [Solirubrobacteraceae bacterium]